MVVTSLLALGLNGPAQAQLGRTFISANGSDGNPCSRAQPCRTLLGAYDQTNAGGEINVLDPAGYGTLTIGKSISIVNDGVGSAGVLVPAGSDGIVINAGASAVVNLRGLVIEGAGQGQNGITFLSGQALTIENCVIRGLAGKGIKIETESALMLAVSNTLVADNGNIGIHIVTTGSNPLKAAFNRVEIHGNGSHGLLVDGRASIGNIAATAVDSVFAYNGAAGIFAASTSGSSPTTITVVLSTSSHNATGLQVGSDNAVIRLGRSSVTGNNAGWTAFPGGSLLSYGDNYIDGNGGGESAPPGTPTK
jgi:hypothetical protein